MLFRAIVLLVGGGLLTFAAPTNAFAWCHGWSGWAQTAQGCENGWYCFGSGQRRTYYHYTRTRQCSNGIQQQTKKRTVCGC